MPTLLRGHPANRSATVGASARTIRAGDAGGPSQLFRCADLHPVGRCDAPGRDWVPIGCMAMQNRLIQINARHLAPCPRCVSLPPIRPWRHDLQRNRRRRCGRAGPGYVLAYAGRGASAAIIQAPAPTATLT